MGFTKFKLLTQRLLSGLGKSKSFFPFYDSENDADYRVSLDTLITFISNELGVSSKAVFELTGVSNTGNNYISTLDISSYRTEGLYIFKPSTDSDDVTTLNVNSVGTLDIKEFDGTSLVDKTDLKAVNTYVLLNKTTYWLVVGGVSGEHPNPTSYLAHATVDGVYGDDSYAELNNPKRPYLTITAAQDALKLAIITTISSPVQCKGFCYVKKGVYFDEYLINRQYVDMHFEYGAIVISDTDGKPVISDTDGNNEPVNINITGQGQFYHTRYNPQGLDNQAIALSNSDSKEFNFEAYEVDGIQIYGGNSITTKLNVKNTRIRYTIFVGNKKSIHFEKCKFLSGLDLDNFFHDDNEITCNECEFIVPSDNLDSLVEIRDLSNTLIDTIDVSSGVQSGEPFQFGSGTRLELQNSHVGAHYHPIIAGIYLSNTYLDVHGNPSINSRYSITNSKIRIQKDGGIGISIIQTCEVNLSQPEHPNWIFRDIQIEDETVNKTTTALVAKKRDTLSTTIPYMFASIISNCEVTIGSGYEAGYVPIEPSYEFVPVDPPVPDLSGYVTRNGNETISRNEIFTTTSDIAFGINGIISNILYISTSQTQLKITNGSKFAGLFLNTDGNDANTKATISVDTKSFEIHKLTGGTMYGDIIKYNSDRTTEINANGLALINRAYADSKYALSGSTGSTNLGYTASPTNGIVTSDTGTDATLTLVDGTNAGLVSPSMKSTWDNKQNTLSIPSDAEMQTGTDNVKYATALRITTWWTWIKTQAQTIAGLWTFSGGITISGGRLLFTNTFTAGGDSWYRQASNVLRATINGTDRIELNTSGVRTKGTHTFEGAMFTNIVPTSKKIATIQTTGELTADYVATTIYQGIQRSLQTLVSSTTETPVFNPEIGSTLIPIGQYFAGVQISYTIPFKLSTTGTVRFLVRFGEAATALTSRTILADTGTFSPAVTAQGGVLKVFFSVGTVGGSGTAVLICNIECQINGKSPVITVPLRTTTGVSTLVDNLLEITCVFGTSSASDRLDVENANAIKIS